MATVRDLVTASLQRLTVIAAGETPSAEDAALGLARLNDLVDGWATERLTIYAITRTVFDLVSGQAAYTVGTGGDVNVARPATTNLTVKFIDTSQPDELELPLMYITDDGYEAIPQKPLQTTYPMTAYYNPTYPLATLTFWPVPNVGYLDGVFYAPAAVSEFTELNTLVSLPPGYRRALRDNLAIEMAPDFETSPSRELVESARSAKADIKRSNIRLADLQLDAAVLPHNSLRPHANIYTGP